MHSFNSLAIAGSLLIAVPSTFAATSVERITNPKVHVTEVSLAPGESQPIPAIHIIVDNGHVTLEGVVRTQQDKDMAGIRASQNMGFGMATNNLRVELPNNHG